MTANGYAIEVEFAIGMRELFEMSADQHNAGSRYRVLSSSVRYGTMYATCRLALNYGRHEQQRKNSKVFIHTKIQNTSSTGVLVSTSQTRRTLVCSKQNLKQRV